MKRSGKFIPVLFCLGMGFILLSWNCDTEKTSATDSGESVLSANKTSDSDEEPSFKPHDVSPEPKGGMRAIQDNLVYPEEMIEAGLEGKVMVYAHIGSDGKVLQTRIVESLDEKADYAAQKAIEKTEWIPAQYQGENTDVWVVVPVMFKVK